MSRLNVKSILLSIALLTIGTGLQATPKKSPQEFVKEAIRTPGKIIKKMAAVPGKIITSIKNVTHKSKKQASTTKVKTAEIQTCCATDVK